MALHIKTINGSKYVYDVKSYRDKETKKVKKKTTYMGPLVNAETKEYGPKRREVIKERKMAEAAANPKQIVNYGDAFLLWESLKKSPLLQAFLRILPPYSDSFLAMLFYKIIDGAASCHAAAWLSGSYARVLFPDANLDSQRISELFAKLGNENVQRAFFKTYIGEISGTKGDVVIDSTGLENEIDIPLTEYSGKDGKNQTRLIMVIDRVTHMPLYFRLAAGNIVDVSTLTTTFSLAKNLGLNPTMAVMDAGYYSSGNIKALCKAGISFLSRLPANRKLYSDCIIQTKDTLENPENIIIYNKRSLYIQKVRVDLYGYKGYAYVCEDVKEIGRKKDNFIRGAKEDKLTNEEIASKMPFIGKFVLTSNKDLSPSELLPLYYARQKAESIFSFAKSNLDLLPLRVHNTQTLKGYTFLSYLAMLLSLEIQNKLTGLCTLQEALKLARNQFGEIFESKTIPYEPNRQLKEIYEGLGVVVVN
jgi:transposase